MPKRINLDGRTVKVPDVVAARLVAAGRGTIVSKYPPPTAVCPPVPRRQGPRPAYCMGCGQLFPRMHDLMHHRRSFRCGGKWYEHDASGLKDYTVHQVPTPPAYMQGFKRKAYYPKARIPGHVRDSRLPAGSGCKPRQFTYETYVKFIRQQSEPLFRWRGMNYPIKLPEERNPKPRVRGLNKVVKIQPFKGPRTKPYNLHNMTPKRLAAAEKRGWMMYTKIVPRTPFPFPEATG